MLLIMIIIGIHNMNALTSKTKNMANDIQFCTESIIEHKYSECKEDRVEHKTCIRNSEYSISECILKK